MIIIKRNWFNGLAFPISKPWFGNNKTYRGLIVIPNLTGVIALLCSIWLGPFKTSIIYDAFFGYGLGLAYILAELPNSYIKRRLGIAHGELSKKYKYLQYFTDKADSIIGVLAFYFLATDTSFKIILIMFFLSIIIHIGISQFLVKLNIKRSF